MAEAILFDIAGSLLKNLGSRALDEIASARGFKTDLEKLKNMVNTIKDVLLDAEERQAEGYVESHAVRRWLDRLKGPLYAADDLFDEFATMASRRESMGKVHSFFSSSNHITFAYNISRKIKKIREELDDIVKDSSQFAFVLRPLEEARLHKRVRDQTYSFVDIEEVIGREDDRDAIVDILMASCAPPAPRLSVIPIVGIGGLGKTTLAQLIYNDARIEEHFKENKFWVCVSEVFDLKEIIKKILMSATNSECKNVEIEQLQGQLRKEISGKKYLLVLDDVWNEKSEEWLQLSTMLKVGGAGSRILVTTRSGKVADIMGTVPAYVLRGLSEEKSWSLFEKMAFEPGESQKKPRLVILGKEIMKKCANVPLALRTLGSLLRGYEEWKWISIADINFSKLRDEQNNMMAILKLSYHHLLSPLKNCFAYCALFPKDYIFDKETLIYLWMAEGFVVPPYETQSLEEFGDHYLMVLLQRCFFQDLTRDEFGNISSFKMHDLMHDLAMDVSGTQSKVAKFLDRNFTNKTLHLSFDHQLTNSWEIPSSMLTTKQLRTFLLPEQFLDGSDFKTAVLQQLISNFRCLRVLDLRNLGIRTLPKSIGKLIHLRYLNLSENPIKKLPNSIIKLQNLQTLILYNCRSLGALPMHTRKLRNLRSLDILDCWINHMPPGLGELTSLHKLPKFIVKSKTSPKFKWYPASAQLRDLKTLNNLNGSLELRIYAELEDPAFEAKEANLIAKHGLTNLLIVVSDYDWELDEVTGDGSKHDEATRNGSKHDEALLEGLKPHQNLKKLEIKWYRGQKLPSWAVGDSLCTTLPNLVEICLTVFDECREVPCFSQLPFLKRLTVWNLRNVEYMEKSPLNEVESTRTFFPSLQELVLRYMGNLKGWWDETKVVDCSDEEKLLQTSAQCHPLSQSFSGLIILQIDGCPSLTSLPVSPNVEVLTLLNVNKELTVLKKVTNSEGSGDVGSSKVKRLRIDNVELLISMPVECLGQLTSLGISDDTKFKNTSELEEVFKHLSSLTSLSFSLCDKLKSISVGMEHLVSLERLKLYWCGELDISEDDMPWKALASLRELELSQLDKLKHLPSGLQYLTNLRNLQLSLLTNLEEVPEWIGCLLSLEYMELNNCDKLTCLPEEMRNLTSLNQLRINLCPRLTNRCRGPNGPDWPYIRHIPHLIVHEFSLI